MPASGVRNGWSFESTGQDARIGQGASTDRRIFLAGIAATALGPYSAGATNMTKQSPRAKNRPVLVFDVNETLLDLNVLASVFARIFGDAGVLREWFNQVILYSEALSLAGEYVDSGKVGAAVLAMLAEIKGRKVEAEALDMLKKASATMPTYPDVPPALESLKRAGFRMVTLGNNPKAANEVQLSNAGIRTFFENLYSIDDEVHRYKPARESYLSIAKKLQMMRSDLWLVSCHAFDTLGAASAGYRTALVLRPENAPIGLGRRPDIVGGNLQIIADALIARYADR
jgi:2-haloacid dehalogenase